MNSKLDINGIIIENSKIPIQKLIMFKKSNILIIGENFVSLLLLMSRPSYFVLLFELNLFKRIMMINIIIDDPINIADKGDMF